MWQNISNFLRKCHTVFHSRYTILLSPGYKSSSFSTSLLFSAFVLPGSLVAQRVKNLPAMWEASVQSLGWEDPLEKGMVTYSSILAWRIPMDSPWGRKEPDTTEQLNAHTCITSNMFSISTIFQMVSYLVLTLHLCGFMKVIKMEVSQSCPTLCDPMN